MSQKETNQTRQRWTRQEEKLLLNLVNRGDNGELKKVFPLQWDVKDLGPEDFIYSSSKPLIYKLQNT